MEGYGRLLMSSDEESSDDLYTDTKQSTKLPNDSSSTDAPPTDAPVASTGGGSSSLWPTNSLPPYDETDRLLCQQSDGAADCGSDAASADLDGLPLGASADIDDMDDAAGKSPGQLSASLSPIQPDDMDPPLSDSLLLEERLNNELAKDNTLRNLDDQLMPNENDSNERFGFEPMDVDTTSNPVDSDLQELYFFTERMGCKCTKIPRELFM